MPKQAPDAGFHGDGSRSRGKPELILTVAQMRAADRAAIAGGITGYALMERAGAAVARLAAEIAARPGPILVICGPGNNGGDGLVAARLLRQRGLPVEVALLGEPAALTGDATRALADWAGPLADATGVDPSAAALVVVGLFGTGLSRPVEGSAKVIIERVNACGRPILAIDIPSGIDGDTGEVRGAAVRAAATVTFAAKKPGHLLLPGRLHCGDLTVAEIGIPDEILRGTGAGTFDNGTGLWLAHLPVPSEGSHKYGRGHTLVCSGPLARTGAARLAARAALRIGSGLVTVASQMDALPENAAQLTAIMIKACDGADGLGRLLEDSRFNALVLGPGLGMGEGTRDLVRVAGGTGRPLVLDADALTSFAGEAARLAKCLACAGGTVLTPHEGEFRRLFAGADEVLAPASKLERARRAAAATGAVVLLKGPDTVVAAPDGRASINAHGSPYLATAGSGDVLAGMIAGLLAQGMPAFEAASAAVWLHGDAGVRVGPGLIAEDLPETLPAVLREVLAG